VTIPQFRQQAEKTRRKRKHVKKKTRGGNEGPYRRGEKKFSSGKRGRNQSDGEKKRKNEGKKEITRLPGEGRGDELHVQRHRINWKGQKEKRSLCFLKKLGGEQDPSQKASTGQKGRERVSGPPINIGGGEQGTGLTPNKCGPVRKGKKRKVGGKKKN